MAGRGAVRRIGRIVDRVMDHRLIDFITGNWFDRPIDNYLDKSNSEKPPGRRRYLDAEGNEIAAPDSAASDGFVSDSQ